MRTAFRIAALVAASVALFFAVRDATGIGFSELAPVSSTPDAWYWHAWGFIRLLMLLVAATLAWRGAADRDARLLAAALIGISFNNDWWFFSATDPLLVPSVALNYVGLAGGLACFVAFAARYGAGDWHGIRRAVGRSAPYLGAWIGVSGTLWWTSLFVTHAPQPIFDRLFWYGWDAVNALTIVASVAGIATSEAERRKATTWIGVSFAIAAGGTAVHGIDRAFAGETDWANVVDAFAQLALPLGLGYAVLRERALQIDFLVSHATVFGVTTTLMTFLFTVAEYVTDRLVADHGILPASLRVPKAGIDIGISFVVVISYKRLEALCERLLERLRDPNGAPRDAEIERLAERVRELEAQAEH